MLTNVEIRAFKEADKPYKRSAGGGLYLLIQPNGSKIWRFAYRFEGRRNCFREASILRSACSPPVDGAT